MNNPKNSIRINYPDGGVSWVDQRTYRLIAGLKENAKNNPRLPLFYNLSRHLESCDSDLIEFYRFLLTHHSRSRSQLYQDLFALFILKEKKDGTFCEFGATNGVELSNSHLLESEYGWRGVLAEPSPQWHKELAENRPKAQLVLDCIYSETGHSLDFFVSDTGVLSTLEEFRNSDAASMPGNTRKRNEGGSKHTVDTISLNDVFIKYFDSAPIDYLSVDTEGSELLILENFDFDKFAPKVVTVEHNFSSIEKELDALFSRNNYLRVFSEQSQFDAWYVLQD